MHRTIFVISTFLILVGCGPSGSTITVAPDHLVITDDDTLECKILRGDILTTTVLSTEGDTLEIENQSIEKIVFLASGRDITSRYIDREAVRIELAKRKALEKKEKLQADVVAGLRKKSELQRIPIAILTTSFHAQPKSPPQVRLTILNLSNKKIELVKMRVHCFDATGKPQPGTRGRNHIFQATSRIPIEAGEDFTTTLTLHNHPRARKAKVEIHYLEYADNTWWKGEVTDLAD
ncbi:MAG TPA: hypothetical protein VNN76_10435 [Bacteroidota bacterium]|nr:hypothetical protein [Bacteroidota bacterium]